MRRARPLAAAVLLIPAAACLLATPAAASSSRVLSLSLRNADGYRVTVTGSGPTVALAVRRHKPKAETVYIVHGKVTASGLRASFPGLGRVAVRFQPARTPGAGPPSCESVLKGTAGVFRGRIEFRGEGGYTTVHAHRAKGRVRDLGKLRGCRGPVKLPHHRAAALLEAILHLGGPGPKTTHVLAEWKQPLGGVFFEAKRVGRDHTEFLAVEEHTAGRLAVLHFATVRARAAALSTDRALTFATVRPPAPFHGSGDLRHQGNGRKVWSGDLAAAFPGAPAVPLTGPGFKTVLGRSWGPLPTVPAPLPKRLLALLLGRD